MKYFLERYNVFSTILTWNKLNPIPTGNNTWLSDIEYCLYFRDSNTKLNDGYDLKSKWFTSPINKPDKDLYDHPTIKPLELVKRHLAHATQPNDIVLDCFSGSGTTCVAAKELDRRFIGIEIDPEYHKISVDRLNGITTSGQTSIFTDFESLGEQQ
jgi:DNA modification methylase